MKRIEDVSAHEYPPDRILSALPGLPFSKEITLLQVGTTVTIVVALIDYIRLGGSESPVPFNYPFYLDIVFVFVALYVAKSLHKQLDLAKRELILHAMISEQRENIPDANIADEEEIRKTFEEPFEWALDPVRMGISGLFVGLFVVAMLFILGVADAYPYLLLSFLYGASHGILIPFLLILPRLLIQVPKRFMNDLNVIDPAGVGGYPEVAASIGKAAWYGTIVVNIDFLILGSAAFLADPRFQRIVVTAYAVELLLLFSFTIGGTFYIKYTLKNIRDDRIRQLQWEFGVNEGLLLSEDENQGEETNQLLKIITYAIVFERLKDMNLMPINMVWWTRFIGSVLATILVIFIQLILVIDLSTLLSPLFES